MARLFAVLAMFICLNPTRLMGAKRSDMVTAQISSSFIVITNQAEQPVCYEIHEADLLKRIEWSPECKDMNQILPHKSARVSFQPGNFSPSDEAVISWWFKSKKVVVQQIRLKTLGQPEQGASANPAILRRGN